MDIVVVDDELVSLTVLKELVDKLPGCDSHGFTDATAALHYCEANDPHLVIVDYMMPGLNGVDFARRLRAIPGKKNLPLLMVTASGDGEVRESALESGINDFINKPFDFVELQARATNMLALRASEKAAHGGELLTKPNAVAQSTSSSNTRVLDLSITRSRLAADESLLSEIARLFISTVPGLLSSIGTASSARDLKQVFALTHSLKGAVAAFEAPEVFNSLAQVEAHAKNDDADAAVAAFALAEALVQRLVQELAPVVNTTPPREAQQ